MKNEIKHFKNKLSDYKYIKEKLSAIEDRILELEVSRGIHSIRYDVQHVQGSCDPLYVALKKLNDTEKADYLDKKKIEFEKRLDEIVNFIKSSEIGDSIFNIHCLQTSTYGKESKRLYMSERTLKRKVNKEITDYLIRGNYD